MEVRLMERRYGKAAYQPQCLADRVREARAAAKFGVIAKTGATSDVTVPGHDGKRMNVLIRKEYVDGAHLLSGECRVCQTYGYQDCKGNYNGICYHTIAAVILLADAQGYDVAFTDSVKAVESTRKFGGTVTGVFSWQNKSVPKIWVIYKERAN
jgi:hypothetical protein